MTTARLAGLAAAGVVLSDIVGGLAVFGHDLIRGCSGDHGLDLRQLVAWCDDELCRVLSDILVLRDGHRQEEVAVERSGVAVYALDRWYDAAYPITALRRYALTSSRQTVVIGSWDHGGYNDADPFRPVTTPPTPSQADQTQAVRAFFDAYLKTDGAKPPPRGIYYSTLGTPGFRFTTAWPPRGLTTTRLYLANAHRLSSSKPAGASRADRYRVRFDATTGTHNRWWALAGAAARAAGVVEKRRTPPRRRRSR